MKVTKRFKFSFPPDLVTQPVIYNMGRRFDVLANIRRANVTRHNGWMIVEITGAESEIDEAVTWCQAQGVEVEEINGSD